MEVSHGTIEPKDPYNEQLINYVHPPDWVNPEPAPKYNLVVIGGGPAGLITASAAAGLGAKVALIEKHLLGGDCLNVGCVPSKCLVASSRVAAAFKEAAEYGIPNAQTPPVDFPAVMERMRKIRAGISHVDSAKRYSEELGVDVFLGAAKFTGRDTVEVGTSTLKFKKAAITTGARAAEIPIPGLSEAGYLTNETVFTLTKQPENLAIIGSGPIGCELAQAFQNLGTKVTVIEIATQILGREDRDGAQVVEEQMRRDGVTFKLGATTKSVTAQEGKKVIHLEIDGTEETISVDEVLLGVGRKPNVEGMDLETAGVEYDPRIGITVTDELQTSNPNIYAAGDVCMQWKFTHAADFAARIVIQNALFSVGPFGRKKLSSLTMPWCTYTHPEVAHVGMYEQDAEDKGIQVDTYVQPLEDNDRALADGQSEGFVKVHVRKGTDKIVGATIVASDAGNMISEITLAMTNKIGLATIANTIHPYPTQSEAIARVGGQYNKTRLTPTIKNIMKRWMQFRL
jgi:pyruvate/2-oxoglutarate dehydrogenase complex dihydrolipoamide dehydrogenase (E3) component